MTLLNHNRKLVHFFLFSAMLLQKIPKVITLMVAVERVRLMFTPVSKLIKTSSNSTSLKEPPNRLRNHLQKNLRKRLHKNLLKPLRKSLQRQLHKSLLRHLRKNRLSHLRKNQLRNLQRLLQSILQ